MAFGQAETTEQRERRELFQLYNECSPMSLVIESLSEDAEEMGLTRDRLTLAAESRLRSAGLYDDVVAVSYFYVRVTVVGSTFSVAAQYKKPVVDLATGLPGPATTWETGTTGLSAGIPTMWRAFFLAKWTSF